MYTGVLDILLYFGKTTHEAYVAHVFILNH